MPRTPRNSMSRNGRPSAATPGNTTVRMLKTRQAIIQDRNEPCIMVCLNPYTVLGDGAEPDMVLIQLSKLLDIREPLLLEFAYERQRAKENIAEKMSRLDEADALIGGYDGE